MINQTFIKRYFYVFSFLLLSCVVFARIYFFSNSENPNVENLLETPSLRFFLGTDSLGRDIFSRILVGGFNSIWVGTLSAFLTVILGTIFGLIAGWNGRRTEKFIMILINLISSLPSFLLISFLGFTIFEIWSPAGFWGQSISLIAMITFTHWLSTARLIRSQVKELKQKLFIEAAIALGGSSSYILRRHLLPHLMGVIGLQLGQLIPICIIYESFVSFVGYGFQSPETSWGLLIQDGWKSLSQYPHLMISPILFLFVTVFSLNLYIETILRSKNHTANNISY